MPRTIKTLLHVRQNLEWIERFTRDLIDAADKNSPGGVVLPPSYRSELFKINLILRAILRKHAAKNTRKDIYVEKS